MKLVPNAWVVMLTPEETQEVREFLNRVTPDDCLFLPLPYEVQAEDAPPPAVFRLPAFDELPDEVRESFLAHVRRLCPSPEPEVTVRLVDYTCFPVIDDDDLVFWDGFEDSGP